MQEAITVSRFNTYIKQIFDAEELLHNIKIVGEVFGVSKTRNVIYFSLKDENSTLPCVCFYPAYENSLQEGESVIITGSPNFYVKAGKLNFNVVNVEHQGQGRLFEEFLAMKERLDKEGLFDISHKKPLPKNIRRVGVITSREGAVIQDIKNVAWRRNPSLDIVLFNTKVQGMGAENEIAHAIKVLGEYDGIDVIIVARGGGSLEDLRAYNSEIVARATYDCPKPIISAVGHEVDFTIIDFVSDLRAPTPSAGAELITYDIQSLKKHFIQIVGSFNYACRGMLLKKQTELSSKANEVVDLVKNIHSNNALALRKLNARFKSVGDSLIHNKSYELGILENTLNKINPQNILEKGFAKIEQNGKSICSSKELLDEEFEIIFKDGKIKGEKI